MARSYRALSDAERAGGLDEDLAIEAFRPLLVAFEAAGRAFVSPETAVAIGVWTDCEVLKPALRPEVEGTTLIAEGADGTVVGTGWAAAVVDGREGPEEIVLDGAGELEGEAFGV